MFTDIGIDLGTYKTTIIAGKKVVLEEPTAVAIDTQTGEPIFFGERAHSIEGRAHEHVQVLHPVERGVVSDLNLATAMLRHFLRKSFGNRMVKPRVVITAPGGATDVQQRSCAGVAEAAGGRNVRVIETATAAAIGLGLNFSMPHGSMIVDIGAGTTDIAVTTMGGVAECMSISVASQDYDEAIIRYVKAEHGVLIGPHTAEHIKKQVGSATRRAVDVTLTVGGVDIVTGMPRAFTVSAGDIYRVTAELTEEIGTAVTKMLENTLPDLAADIADEGIHLIGGGAQMCGFEEYIAARTGVPARLAEFACECVSRGAGIAVRNPNLLRNADYAYRTRQSLISDET